VKRSNRNRSAARRGLVVLALAVLVPLLCGCGLTEKRVGPIIRRVTATRTDVREAPVPDWPVWVFVNGAQVGAFRTDANGEVPLNYQPYLAGALQSGGLNVEFRFRQPDGRVEQKFLRLTAAQLGGR
jgi:hypothetical protein